MAEEIVGVAIATLADGEQQRVVLREGQEARIGRDASNDIVVDDAGVSRVHASLSVSSTGVVIADAASLNGTYINGARLEGMRDVTSRDVVNIGSAKISFELESDKSAAQLSSSTSSRAMTAQMHPVSVSVLVSTIIDFDKLAEQISTEEITQLHLLWSHGVRERVREFDGKVDKIIGPTIVAVWIGHDPKPLALRAARTMHKIMEFTNELENESPDLLHGCTWQASTVLASGFGLCGSLGANAQGTAGFTMLGDPINAAFDLLPLARNIGSNAIVDETSADMVRESLSLKELPDIPLPKGYAGNATFTIV